MLRTIIWYLHFPISLIAMTPKMIRMKRLKKELSDEAYSDLVTETVRKWALSQVKLTGADIKVEGSENIPKDGPVLFVSNHQSNFDIAVFLSFIPKSKGFVAKAELLKVPLLRTWMRYLNCVFLDRSDIKKSARAITSAIQIIKSGYSMVIFPEGTRSKTGQLGEFKNGAFRLAAKPKVPIVPVTINGTRNIMENAGYYIRPAQVQIVIHPPVYTVDLTREEEAALPGKVKAIVESALI